MKYVLEPLLFAFDKDISKKELESFLIVLQDFDEWWSYHKDQIYILSSTSALLYENGYYPYEDSLSPLLDKFGINYVSYKDIGKILDKYLTKTNLIDVICNDNKTVVLEQKESIDIDEKLFACKRPIALHKELSMLLWFVYYLNVINKDDYESYVIFVKGITEDISVAINYDMMTEKGGFKSGTDKVQYNSKGSLAAFLEDKKTPLLLWRFAEDKTDLELGVRSKICQEKGFKKIGDTYCCDFTIQNSFFADYLDGHYQNRFSDIRSTINSVYDAITDGRLRQMHSIREGAGGGNKDLVVNGFDAKRRNITTSIKLAYWKKGNRYFIANMKEHDIVDITEEFE